MQKNRMTQALVIALAVLLVTAWTNLAAAPDKLKPGDKAPDFTLKDVNTGKMVTLSDFTNKKIVIVHFWKAK
ncbi:redoxin domain-containing protein [bacterium]|nr:redoxin domain-containing protein [bacterium]